MLEGALIGGLMGVIITLSMIPKQKKLAESKKIELEDLKKLEKGSYILYYIGLEKQVKKLKIDNLKHVDLKTLHQLKKADKENLPFDLSKKLVIATPNLGVLTTFDKIASKHNIDYSFLGEYAKLIKEL